ncbi:hypothetical protein BDR26DRAFT_916251 [Obelidium mucronatum]|nr:hypothetical protein BDR26DRAFT_916251 [Obelidium mucronatum]
MPQKIMDHINFEAASNNVDEKRIRLTMTGETCKSKWKAMLMPVTKQSKIIRGTEGTGSAPVLPPPFYAEITEILGESSSVKGPYTSRNSMATGRLARTPLESDPKSDTPMTAFALGYDAARSTDDCAADLSIDEFLAEVDDVLTVSEETADEEVVMVAGRKRKQSIISGNSSESGKKMRQTEAAKELERLQEKQEKGPKAIQTPKPPKSKKEEKSRITGGEMSSFQSQYLELMGEGNKISSESLAVQKESLRQYGLDQDQKRKDASEMAKVEQAKFMAMLAKMSGPSVDPDHE